MREVAAERRTFASALRFAPAGLRAVPGNARAVVCIALVQVLLRPGVPLPARRRSIIAALPTPTTGGVGEVGRGAVIGARPRERERESSDPATHAGALVRVLTLRDPGPALDRPVNLCKVPPPTGTTLKRHMREEGHEFGTSRVPGRSRGMPSVSGTERESPAWANPGQSGPLLIPERQCHCFREQHNTPLAWHVRSGSGRALDVLTRFLSTRGSGQSSPLDPTGDSAGLTFLAMLSKRVRVFRTTSRCQGR